MLHAHDLPMQITAQTIQIANDIMLADLRYFFSISAATTFSSDTCSEPSFGDCANVGAGAGAKYSALHGNCNVRRTSNLVSKASPDNANAAALSARRIANSPA